MRRFVLAAALFTGCTGEIVDPISTTNGAGAGGNGPTKVEPPCTPPADPGRVVMKRLNRREYDNTVRDLFALSSHPGEAFPRDNVATFFDNDAALLGITSEQLDIYATAAEKVAAEAMRTQRSRLVTCDAATGEACARQLISTWGRRMFRGALAAADVDFIYTRVFAPSRADGDTFDQAFEVTLQYLLTHPRFLYRVELHSAPNDPAVIETLDGAALATRLSYFLLASTPDDTLLDLAEQKDSGGVPLLAHDEVLLAQADRLLKDPRAQSLSDVFATQWLGVEQLDVVAKSPMLFPSFDDALKADMKAETQAFLRDVLTSTRGANELVTSRFAFVNERLAKHYGIAGVQGPELRKVYLAPETHRAGFMSQGSFLTINSEIGRTSIVKRGEYVLARLLCSPPGAPPAGVKALPAEEETQPMTLRQRLENHRAQPACAGCHSRMDPIGFGLENFDAVGQWRTEDHGEPIDASGRFPDGTTFSGAIELADVIGQDSDLSTCMAQNLASYALGRSVNGAERCAVSKLAAPGQSMPSVVRSLVVSDLFKKHRGDDT